MAVVRKQDHSSILLWSIYSCTAYYEKLPVGWVKTSLGNIVYLLSGRDLATADYSDSLTTGIPY
ncbi:hypothetical protein, partial [Enterococcus faecalis]